MMWKIIFYAKKFYYKICTIKHKQNQTLHQMQPSRIPQKKNQWKKHKPKQEK